jgi:hypothetical protein
VFVAVRRFQPLRARKRDHGAVVSAELEPRVVDRVASGERACVQGLPEQLVRANAARYHQAIEIAVLEGGNRFFGEHFDDRLLQFCCEIGACRMVERAFARGEQNGRFSIH